MGRQTPRVLLAVGCAIVVANRWLCGVAYLFLRGAPLLMLPTGAELMLKRRELRRSLQLLHECSYCERVFPYEDPWSKCPISTVGPDKLSSLSI